MLVTTAVMPFCRTFASNLGLVDQPDDVGGRKLHRKPTPHSGGLAIVAGVFVSTLLWLPVHSRYLELVLALVCILVVGLLDDIWDFRYGWKLAGQILAASIIIAFYGGIPQLPFFPLDSSPPWLVVPVTLVFLIGVTNAVNLSDGLDGLAAGHAILSLAVLGLFAAQVNETGYVVLALALAGGLMGFLRFNTHPAQIFMGDTGSQFLGFMGATLSILVMQNEQVPFSPLVPVVLFGLPILDTITVIGIRWAKGRPVMVGDRSHLHHQLLQLGLYHYEVVVILYVLQAICCVLAYSLRYASDGLLLFAYAAFALSVVGLIGSARISGWKAHRGTAKGTDVERRNLLLRQLGWYHHNTGRILAAGLCTLLLGGLWFSDTPGWVPALAVAGVPLSAVLLHRRYPRRREGWSMRLLSRLVSYTASLTLIYLVLFDRPNSLYLPWLDVFIGLLGLALILAVRLTRRVSFHLDSEDYLVVILVIGASLFIRESFDGVLSARLVLYAVVLLYTSEYIVTRGRGTRWLLDGASLACIAGVMVYG